MRSWQKVYDSELLYKAEMVRSILEEYGLDPVIKNARDSAYPIGQYEVYVSPDHVIRAIKVINEEIKL